LDAFSSDVQLAGETEQFNQGLACRRQGVTRGDGVLGFNVDDQLVEVGALLHTGGLDLVADLQDRGVDLIDRDTADVTTGCGHGGGDVTTSTLDDELNLQLCILVQGCNVQIRVVDLHVCRWLDVAGSDDARALLAEVHDHRLIRVGGQNQALDVQDDVGDSLLDPVDRGELVEHTVDLHAGDRCARDGRQQGTAEGVTEGVTETRLQRLNDELGTGGIDEFLGEGRSL